VTYNELFLAIKNYLQNDFPTNAWTSVSGGGTSNSTATQQINTFIKQAEKRVYNTVQIPSLRKNVTGVTTNGNSYLSCPSDFLSVFSMAVISNTGVYTYLLNKDVNFIREVYPSAATSGLPKYYALFGPTVASSTITDELSFLLGPTPNSAYNVELHYYYYPESIIQSPIATFGSITAGSGYTNGTYFETPLTRGTGGGATANIVDSVSATLPGGTAFTVPVASVGNENGRTWLGDNYSPALLYGALVEGYIFMKGEQDMMAYYEKKFMDALSQLNRLGTGLERGDAYRDGQAKIKVNP